MTTPLGPGTVTLPYGGPADNATKTYLAPREWHPRIEALAPCLIYGPAYRRAVVYSLDRMSGTVEAGFSASAYDHLLAAERAAN